MTSNFDLSTLQTCRCQGRSFHVDPILAGAFPGTPVYAVDLTQGESSSERTWFKLDFLENLRLMRKNSPRLSITSQVQTMFEMHLKTRGRTLPSKETLSKNLHKTLEEYENLKFQEAQGLQDVAQPPSLLCNCPACAQMIETIGIF